MIKFLLLLSILGSKIALADHHTPSGDSYTMPELNFRYFRKHSPEFKWLGEARARQSFDDHVEHHFRFGGRYRLSSGFKAALYLQAQKNMRHEENWEHIGSDWEWTEEDNPIEIVPIAEVLYRAMLLDKVRGEMRVQYRNNTTNTHQTVIVRPELNYFWFRRGKIFANVFFQHERFMALNYSDNAEVQIWNYIGFLYHATPNHKFGFSVNQGYWVWRSSPDTLHYDSDDQYAIRDEATILGLNYVFTH